MTLKITVTDHHEDDQSKYWEVGIDADEGESETDVIDQMVAAVSYCFEMAADFDKRNVCHGRMVRSFADRVQKAIGAMRKEPPTKSRRGLR